MAHRPRDIDPSLLGRLVAETTKERCPPAEELMEAASAGPTEIDPDLSAHLAVCDPCRAAMEALATPLVEAPRKRFTQPLAAAAVLVLALVFLGREFATTPPQEARAAMERGDLKAAVSSLDSWLREADADTIAQRRSAALWILSAGLEGESGSHATRPPRPESLVFRGASSAPRRILSPIGLIRDQRPRLRTTAAGSAARVRLRRFGEDGDLTEIASLTLEPEDIQAPLAPDGDLPPGRYHLLVESREGNDMVEFRIPSRRSIEEVDLRLRRIQALTREEGLREGALGVLLLREGFRLEALEHLRRAASRVPPGDPIHELISRLAGELGLDP